MTDGLRLPDETLPPDEAAAAWCLRMADGPMGEEDDVVFRAWIASDPDNQMRFDMVAAFWSEVDAQASQPEMIRLRETTLATYRRAQTRRWAIGRMMPSFFRRPAVWLAMAAVFAGLLVLTPRLVDRSIHYETGIGERRAILLADGSRLSLDADSEVTVRYEPHHRMLELVRGRANFIVAKDKTRPFSVTSGTEQVIATGTAFTVEKLSSETQVTLYDGHIRIVDTDGHAIRSRLGAQGPVGPAETLLVPGRRLILAHGARTGRIAPATEASPQAWETGQLEFIDEPLANAAERINRYATGRRIAVSADAAGVMVDGLFNAGDARVFATEVSTTFGLKHTDDGRVITLSRQ